MFCYTYPSSHSALMSKIMFSHHQQTLIDEKNTQGGILNKHDYDGFETNSFNLTFSLLLDSGVRLFAHVLRYLPVHHRVKNRLDVGRRAERAFVILTRAVGGEEFYRCLLK
jgi:hypothetical protein